MSACPRIVLTSGEPAGIGPDLCLQITQQRQQGELIVIADPELLRSRMAQLGLTVHLEKCDLSQPPSVNDKQILKYIPMQLAEPVTTGLLNKANADYVLATLNYALATCLAGKCDALVTAPVHKGIINDAGIAFTGHTEFFADGAGVDQVVMLLATATLRVALATTHLPLMEVSSAITRASLIRTITIINDSLRQFYSIKQPRIAVCGLNPHAGENGYLGREEIETISPVIKLLANQGLAVSGPWPADTIFVKDSLAEYDIVLAMYHDQGLPVLKQQGFGDAVNITLGLPFIRTSVDHGTALALAGTGKAQVTSLQAAINRACEMVRHKEGSAA